MHVTFSRHVSHIVEFIWVGHAVEGLMLNANSCGLQSVGFSREKMLCHRTEVNTTLLKVQGYALVNDKTGSRDSHAGE